VEGIFSRIKLYRIDADSDYNAPLIFCYDKSVKVWIMTRLSSPLSRFESPIFIDSRY